MAAQGLWELSIPIPFECKLLYVCAINAASVAGYPKRDLKIVPNPDVESVGGFTRRGHGAIKR